MLRYAAVPSLGTFDFASASPVDVHRGLALHSACDYVLCKVTRINGHAGPMLYMVDCKSPPAVLNTPVLHSLSLSRGCTARCAHTVHKLCTGPYPSCIVMPSTSNLVMHLYELLASFALISSVMVCVVLHPFLQVRGIYQEFGFGSAPFRLGIWTGTLAEHTYWRCRLDRMTVGRVQLPNSPICVLETMQAPEWPSYLSIIDGALNPVPLCDLDQPMLKEIMAENCGLVSYIPNQYILHPKSAHQMPGLSNIVGV